MLKQLSVVVGRIRPVSKEYGMHSSYRQLNQQRSDRTVDIGLTDDGKPSSKSREFAQQGARQFIPEGRSNTE